MLKGVIPLRMNLAQAADKLGVPGINSTVKIMQLRRLGISEKGIDVGRLRTSLKMSLPDYLKLRDGEKKTAENCELAIVGRLAVSSVFEPFNIRLTLQRDDLTIEDKIAIAAAHLQEVEAEDPSIFVKPFVEIVRWAYLHPVQQEVFVIGVAEYMFQNNLTIKGEFIQQVMDGLEG